MLIACSGTPHSHARGSGYVLLGLPCVRLPDQAPAPALQRRFYAPGTDRDRRTHRPVPGGQSAQPGTVGQAPSARLSPATCLSSLTPLRPLPGPTPPPALHIPRCSSAARNPCSAPPLQPTLISQRPLLQPPRTPYRSLPTQLESLQSFLTHYVYLPSPPPLPPKPPSQSLDTSQGPFHAPLLTQRSSFILARIPLPPLILVPSANAPCGLPISSACSPELPPQAPEFFQSPVHLPQSTVSAKSRALYPADSQSHLSLPGPFISTLRSAGYDRSPSPCQFSTALENSQPCFDTCSLYFLTPDAPLSGFMVLPTFDSYHSSLLII